MTSNARRLIRNVDDMLLDAGQQDAAELRAALLSLGSLASLPAPEPGAELAALLSGQTHQLTRHRLLRKHRTSLVGLAVAAGMGLGVTGVAATGAAPGVDARNSIQHLLEDWTPSWSITGFPSASGGAEDLTDTPPPVEPASLESAPPTEPGTVEPAPPGNIPERAGTNAGTGTNRGPGQVNHGNAASPGGQAYDGGAGGNAVSGTASGAAAQDAARAGKDVDKAAADAAAELEQAGKLVTGTLAEAATAAESLTLAPTEKTEAGKAGPGSLWLKKFSR